jgi:hypothetical protein
LAVRDLRLNFCGRRSAVAGHVLYLLDLISKLVHSSVLANNKAKLLE